MGKIIRGYDRNQVLIGTLLGDAGLVVSSPKKKTIRLRIKHKVSNTDYLEWIASYLGTFSEYHFYTETWKTHEYTVLAFRASKKFYYMWKRFYSGDINKLKGKSGKKVVRQSIVNSIDALAVAVWYMDDGTLDIIRGDLKSIQMYACGFTKGEQQLLADRMKKKFNINFSIHPMTIRKKNGKVYSYYRLITDTVDDALKFIKLVYPYVYQVKSMRYKIGFPDNNFINRADAHKQIESFVSAGNPEKRIMI